MDSLKISLKKKKNEHLDCDLCWNSTYKETKRIILHSLWIKFGTLTKILKIKTKQLEHFWQRSVPLKGWTQNDRQMSMHSKIARGDTTPSWNMTNKSTRLIWTPNWISLKWKSLEANCGSERNWKILRMKNGVHNRCL